MTLLEIERRRLGRSELTVPRVALGCGNFGGVRSARELFGEGLSQDEAFAPMDAAWEQGIELPYGGGRQTIGTGSVAESTRCSCTRSRTRR